MTAEAPSPAPDGSAVPTPGSLRTAPAPAPLSAADTVADAQEAGALAGDPRVDDALSRLAELDGLPLAEQVAVFADIQRRLEGVLADPDARG